MRSEPDAMATTFENSTIVPSYSPDMAGEIDSLEDILRERLAEGAPIDGVIEDIMSEQLAERRREIYAEMLLKILLRIADSSNPKLDIEDLIAASGLPLRQGISHTEIAKKHGITRACFSARVKAMLKTLNLITPRACKAPDTKETYKLSNRRNFKPLSAERN